MCSFGMYFKKEDIIGIELTLKPQDFEELNEDYVNPIST